VEVMVMAAAAATLAGILMLAVFTVGLHQAFAIGMSGSSPEPQKSQRLQLVVHRLNRTTTRISDKKKSQRLRLEEMVDPVEQAEKADKSELTSPKTQARRPMQMVVSLPYTKHRKEVKHSNGS
jgi:hypothetical protein